MPRRTRRWQPDGIQHAFARCHSGRSDLDPPEMRGFIVRRGRRAFDETGARCFGWAILKNHYHVLAKCKGAPGPTFARINTAIAMRVRRQQGERGAVLESRYKSFLCTSEASLVRRLVYVLANPLHHHAVATVEELCHHPWSGLGELLGLREPIWVDVHETLSLLAEDPNQARILLLEEIHRIAREWAGLPPAPDEEFDSQVDELVATASDRGTKLVRTAPVAASTELALLAEAGSLVPAAVRQVLEREGWTPAHLVSVACTLTGADPSRMREDRSTRSVAARALVTFVATDVAGLTLAELGLLLGRQPNSLVRSRRLGRTLLRKMGVTPVQVLAYSRVSAVRG